MRKFSLFLSIAPLWLLAACAAHRRTTAMPDYGIPVCPAAAGDELLSPDALQCWFKAPHGRWRTVSHESHFAVLVAQVEATDVRDAEVIARRFVDGEHETFSEILVYVQDEQRDDRPTRRIRWTTRGGFESLDFATPARP